MNSIYVATNLAEDLIVKKVWYFCLSSLSELQFISL